MHRLRSDLSSIFLVVTGINNAGSGLEKNFPLPDMDIAEFYK